MINLVFEPEVLTLSPENNKNIKPLDLNEAMNSTAEKTTHLIPGVLELFQWLSSLEKVSISLFSSESSSANELFFFEQTKVKIRKFSEKDLNKDGQGIRTSFNCCNKKGYKDLSIIPIPDSSLIEENGESNDNDKIGTDIVNKLVKTENTFSKLSNTILIDTSILPVLKGQEKNFLYVPKTSLENYKYSPSEKNHSFKYKPLSCFLSMNKEDCEKEIKKVKERKSILVILEKEFLQLCFLNKRIYETKDILKEENLELFNELNAQEFNSDKSTFILTNKTLIYKIYEQVSNFGGKTTKKSNLLGYKSLSCFLSKNKYDCRREIEKVKEGKSILIILEKDFFHACFLIKDSFNSELFSKEQHLELFNELCTQKFDNYKSTLSLTNKKLNKKIYNLVLKFGGKATKIYLKINRIFYLAGILSHALDEFNEKKIPLSETLFNLQHEKYTSSYLKGTTQSYYKQSFHKVLRKEFFYKKGLKLLQNENPNLSFSSPIIEG